LPGASLFECIDDGGEVAAIWIHLERDGTWAVATPEQYPVECLRFVGLAARGPKAILPLRWGRRFSEWPGRAVANDRFRCAAGTEGHKTSASGSARVAADDRLGAGFRTPTSGAEKGAGRAEASVRKPPEEYTALKASPNKPRVRRRLVESVFGLSTARKHCPRGRKGGDEKARLPGALGDRMSIMEASVPVRAWKRGAEWPRVQSSR